MLLTASLPILTVIALAVVLAEIVRRAASGRGIEDEMRRTADLAPITRQNPLNRLGSRQAA